MEKKRLIGIDIGGTKIQIGVILNGIIEKELKFPTNNTASKNIILQEIIAKIESLELDFEGIGIGVPGLVDEELGIVYDLNNIKSWDEVHLKAVLEKHFEKPVFVTNDANMFALGEKTFGNGRNFKNFVGISIGTGFGAGIVINNRLYGGSFSGAGELGSMPYLNATVEDYCSGKFFKKQHDISGSELFRRAKDGNENALAIFEEYGRHLGNAIKMLMLILSPEAIFIGGSVSKSFGYFEKGMRESLNSFPFKRVLDRLVVESSDISKVSIYGAAALVQERYSEKRDSA